MLIHCFTSAILGHSFDQFLDIHLRTTKAFNTQLQTGNPVHALSFCIESSQAINY